MTGHIVVGADLSDASLGAVRWAMSEAALRSAAAEIVHAWDYPFIERLGDEVQAELETKARADLDAFLEPVAGEDGGLEVTRTVMPGSPAGVLVEASRGADLLVVGSHGRGGLAGMLLGSVSQQCAHHAHCPVVIVPRGPRA